MKDSGIPWIGEIPEGWNIGKVKNYYSFTTGFTPDSKNENYYDESGVPWITIADLNGKRFIKSSGKGISNIYIEKYNPVPIPTGSLLYSFKLSVGQVAITQNTLYTNEAIAAFVNLTNEQTRFLYYSSQVCIIQNANVNIYGAKLLNQELISNALVVYPPINEQCRIADFLDKKCGEIDEMVALQEEFISELKAYKQSVITEAVTKGLDPNVPMKDSGVEWIGEIPDGWQVKRLKHLCKIETGNQDTQDAIEDGQFPFYVRSPHLEKSNRYSFEGEGILMAGDGAGAGRVFHHAYGKYAVHQRVYRMSDIKDIESNYLFYYISNLFARVMDMGSAQSTVPSVRLPMLNNFVVCIPSTPDQQRIADYLDQKCADIDTLIAIKQQKIDDLKEYKKSIIYEYVTGKKEI